MSLESIHFMSIYFCEYWYRKVHTVSEYYFAYRYGIVFISTTYSTAVPNALMDKQYSVRMYRYCYRFLF